MNKFSFLLSVAFLTTLFLFTGCSGSLTPSSFNPKESRDLTSEVAEPKALRQVSSLLVLPLQTKGGALTESGLTFPFYSSLLSTFISESNVEIKGGAAVIDPRSVPQGVKARGEAVALGKKLGVDAVLMTELMTLVERQGSSIGANVPARVGFFMVMLDVNSGDELWRASYHVTDQALSDNLLDMKESGERGARWRTANELLERGFILAARDFGSRRRSQFLS